MPNPFKRPGRAFHQPTDWVAPDVALIRKLAQALSGGDIGNAALIGDIGQGKTAAISYYAEEAAKSGVVLQYALQSSSPDEALNLLYGPIYNDLLDQLGLSVADTALKKLGLHGKTREPSLRRDHIIRLIQEMTLAFSALGKPVHIVVDKCQLPAEGFEERNDVRRTAEWWESLMGIAEAIANGNGHLVIAITPSPWISSTPQKVRDRFTEIAATTPEASEIQSLVEAGLKRAPDGPKRAAKDIGSSILKSYEESADITVRFLHERLHRAWERARKEGAKELTVAHIRP